MKKVFSPVGNKENESKTTGGIITDSTDCQTLKNQPITVEVDAE